VLSVADDVNTWQPGDTIVIASNDYDMNHAEVFTLVRCPSCTANQVKLNGQYSLDMQTFCFTADALFFLSLFLHIPLPLLKYAPASVSVNKRSRLETFTQRAQWLIRD